MAKFPLSAAPTALLARERMDLEQALQHAFALSVLYTGFDKEGGKPDKIEVTQATLIVLDAESNQIENIEFVVRNYVYAVNVRIFLAFGRVALDWTDEQGKKIETSDHISTFGELEPLNVVHTVVFVILNSFWDQAVARLEQMFTDPDWKIAATGICVGNGETKRRQVPRQVLSRCERDKSGTLALRREHMIAGGWSQSVVETNLGRKWRSVEVLLGVRGSPTATQLKRARERRCTELLVEMMRAAPTSPRPKESCRKTTKASIEDLTHREFDRAWQAAHARASQLNPNTKWGRPGRPRN
jgi:hypothetical protein